jgi:uncharacterized protein
MISKKTIRSVVDDIVKKCKPRKVILFGSYARGNPTEDSDLDIFVVSDWRVAWAEKVRRVRRAITASGISIDVVVRSPGQVRKSLSGRDWFVQEIYEQGQVLYERRDR